MKIRGFTPSSGAFSKWFPDQNADFFIEISVSQHLIITDIHKFISGYMFLRMTNTVILVKNSLHIKKDFKIHDGRQFWPKNRYQYEIN